MIIVVRGVPAPQGSKRHVGGGRMIESSRAVGPWREAVRAETQRAMELTAITDCAVHVGIRFWLPRPKSLPKRVVHHLKKPDLDKLGRAVLDGLTDGGAWLDDSQVVKLILEKRYVTGDHFPGCVIEIRNITE